MCRVDVCLVVVRVRVVFYYFIQCLGSVLVHAASFGTALLRHCFLLLSYVVSEVVPISGESRRRCESYGGRGGGFRRESREVCCEGEK